MMDKSCGTCGEIKPLSEFHKNTGKGDGHRSICKPCAIDYRKRYSESEEGKRKNRDRMFRNKYGITIEQYEEMLEAQGGVCAICEGPETASSNVGGEKMLAVDHDEETGVVRGLLCSSCNIGIGMLRHDIDRLTSALSYLLRQNETATAIA